MKYSELYIEGCRNKIINLCDEVSNITARDERFYTILSRNINHILLIYADLIELGLIKEMEKDETI